MATQKQVPALSKKDLETVLAKYPDFKETDVIEYYEGDAIGREKSIELLNEILLPEGLLPLEDIIEVGYNRTTGYVWLKQQKKKTHNFKSIDRLVTYDTEVTAFCKERKLKKLTGVKARELMVWIPIHDIFIKEDSPDKITFANLTGISRTFPTSTFHLAVKDDAGADKWRQSFGRLNVTRMKGVGTAQRWPSELFHVFSVEKYDLRRFSLCRAF